MGLSGLATVEYIAMPLIYCTKLSRVGRRGECTITSKSEPSKLAAASSRRSNTVRTIAKEFGVSKSTVHKDLTERLPEINPDLANQVKHILEYHKSIRHLRGGEATKIKYRKTRNPEAFREISHGQMLKIPFYPDGFLELDMSIISRENRGIYAFVANLAYN